MATSLQERLKLKQYQVDTWTTQEQLCLASAVMRSGDQNWVAVRRNIKMLTSETSRPPDWYSTKNCALQYARLLEHVDTPKRKRERGDGGNETPGEIVTKMLSKQRVEELQALVAEERATYNQQRRDMQLLEAGKLDHQLDALWEQLIKEQAEEEEEEQRHQQWLKDREEKITAIQQALKHQGPKVPQPPHKKKHKLQVGVCGVLAESRRSSGLSETSSEVDSAVESPDLNEVTSESLVSNKSQDEGGAGESEVRPTPTSPLLSSLLSKSPITGVPGAASSPLAQLGVSSRGMRGLGISTVSEALQNLVSSAISGTDTTDKDKPTHTSPATGSSTLSLLLDLPPSTPGGPLPRLSDLPGSTYEQREQEKRTASVDNAEKVGESCLQNKGCEDETVVEEASVASEKPTETVELMAVDGEDAAAVLEESQEDTPMQEEKEGCLGEGVGEKVAATPELEMHGPEEEKEEETNEGMQLPPKEEEKIPVETKVKDSEAKDIEEKERCREIDDLKIIKEKTETIAETHDKVKTETECPDAESTTEKTGETSNDQSSFLKSEEKVAKEETPTTACEPVVKEPCKKQEDGCEKKEDCQQGEEKGEREGKGSGVEKEEEKEETEQGGRNVDEESSSTAPKSEDSGQGSEGDKRPKKSLKKDEEDLHENQDSKDWVSEEEGSTFGSRKRKISGGDIIGSSSPLISESAPNSPASTHYGDDSENERAYRSWKKPIMILWNDIAAHKFASLFLRPITDDQAPGYHSIVYRPMDLQKIKRNIESGVIRTTAEFQRDIMLMFLNATMYNTRDHNVYHMAHQMMKDAVSTIQDFLNTQMLVRAEETPQKSLRRETRESSAKRSDDDPKRKRDPLDEKSLKKRRLN